MKQTTKETITRSEYLQIVGLLALAANHERHMLEIQKALQALTGETDDGGHCQDAIWSGQKISADDLIKKLGVAVA